jgi:hypothetical protein
LSHSKDIHDRGFPTTVCGPVRSSDLQQHPGDVLLAAEREGAALAANWRMGWQLGRGRRWTRAEDPDRFETLVRITTVMAVAFGVVAALIAITMIVVCFQAPAGAPRGINITPPGLNTK